MPTRQEIQDRLAAIEKKKTDALKALKVKKDKLKARLAELDRPTRSQRRADARRKILLGAFVLEQLERTGASPQSFSLEGQRFFDWLVRPTDRAVFEEMPSSPPIPEASSPTPRAAAAGTVLNVPFADKDQAKALGAHWHADQKRWIVPPGLDLAPFAPWMGSNS